MKKQKTSLIPIALLFAVFLLNSCEQYTITFPEVGYESFTASVQPVFTADCAGCHGGGLSPNLSDGSAYVSLTTGNYLDLDNPEESPLIQKLNGSHKGYTTAPNVELILTWIQEGAPND